MLGRHVGPRDHDSMQGRHPRPQPLHSCARGFQHREPVAAAPDRGQHQGPIGWEVQLAPQRGAAGCGRLAHDEATVVQLRAGGGRDRVGLRHVVETGPAVDRDAVVQLLERLVYAQRSPLIADTVGFVHDVAQSEHEPRRGVALFERVEAVAEFPRRAQGLVIHQHQVRSEAERGLAQQHGADAAESAASLLFVVGGRIPGRGGQARGQLDVVAALGHLELARDRGLGRDVNDQVRVAREQVPGDRQRPGDVSEPATILRVQQDGSGRRGRGCHHWFSVRWRGRRPRAAPPERVGCVGGRPCRSACVTPAGPRGHEPAIP